MNDRLFLGLDCGSVSLNVVLLQENNGMLDSLYLRTGGRPRETVVSALEELSGRHRRSRTLSGAYVTGSGRTLLSECLHIPAVNEISAHATGAFRVNPAIRTIIEIGGQDSKFIRMEPPESGTTPRIAAFRMNEICAAGTGSFLDEQADRLGIPVESFQDIASQASEPAAIAGRCAVFAKTDMIHQAQEGTRLPEILLGVAYALVRNYIATLIRGDEIQPVVSLQGGVMANTTVVSAFRDLLELDAHEIIMPPHFKVLGALGCAVMAQRDACEETITLADLIRNASKPIERSSRSAAHAPLERQSLHATCTTHERVQSVVRTRRCSDPWTQNPSCPHLLKGGKADSPPRKRGAKGDLLAPDSPKTEKRGSPSEQTAHEPPYVMGLDVGSVSVKGVTIDSHGSIVATDYRLSSGRPLEALQAVIDALSHQGPHTAVYAITGSGRILAGRLIQADLTVNEITAQARAAVSHDPDVDTIVEIGGQDSKWISLVGRTLRDFEMNRVCAAGTGSFLMEQADRLGLHMGEEFSEAAFSSACPSDLGTRCTVFMESDLIHHQNNGSSRGDLAAGVCVSIVRNYLERVANHKALGERIMFLGGVAANDAVRSAFQRETGRTFASPDFYKVSGALGAALKALDGIQNGSLVPKDRSPRTLDIQQVAKTSFACSGCSNQCKIDKYSLSDRIVFHGGRCDRWEVDGRSPDRDRDRDMFSVRSRLLEDLVLHGVNTVTHSAPVTEPENWNQSFPGTEARATKESAGPQTTFVGRASLPVSPAKAGAQSSFVDPGLRRGDGARNRDRIWETEHLASQEGHGAGREAGVGKSPSLRQTLGVIRSPHFYEWFPFWKAFWDHVGFSLRVAPPPDRKQFEQGTRFLRVETCLPMKVMAGQIRMLVDEGVKTIFHPAILNEEPLSDGGKPVEHCPYIQASSQFFKGSFNVQWLEPVIGYEHDPDSFRDEHIRLAQHLGTTATRAEQAFEAGMAAQVEFQSGLERVSREFLDSLGPDEQALLILGKPYHTSEPFLNMNIGSLLHRLGIKAIPGDIFPLETFPTRNPIVWKHQLRMIGLARAIAQDSRLFPVMITFFGCGPDPFTVRHIKESLKGKPLLLLEMDEHSSRAGIMTRLEAFLDHIKAHRAGNKPVEATSGTIQSARALSSSAQPLREDAPSNNGPRTRLQGSAPVERVVPARGNSSPDRESNRNPSHSSRRVDAVYLPYFGDHTHAFAAAARSVGIEADVLPPPDEESQRLGRPHLMGGECHPYALMLGDYLRLASRITPDEARRTIFCVPGYSACRLRQYPVYIDKIRKERGCSMRVIADLSQALTAFGLSKRHRDSVVLRTWEGLNAYEVLVQAYLMIRPGTRDTDTIEAAYVQSKASLFDALSRGAAVEGLEDALHVLWSVPVAEQADRPSVAVTGDYYTRIVSYANNEVFREIEALGGTIWSPPTFSDGLKQYYLQEVFRNSVDVGSREFEAMSEFYASLVLSELRIKGSALSRKAIGAHVDPLGRRARRVLATHMDPRYPPGMGAPLATAVSQIDRGAHGVLNLITLNCSYGTVVTAALGRVLKDRPGFPMLTLVYDGLKKTNERTRLEAFMDQVHDRFERR